MSISRRGLTAAGLALATVGAIGFTSTLNAGAATIAATTTADTAETSTTQNARAASRATPPPPLPGADLAKMRAQARARTGAQDQPLTLTPRMAPKGNPRADAALSRQTATKAIAPLPPSTTASELLEQAAPGVKAAAVHYLYSSASQSADAEGVYANITIAKPSLAPSDFHSLAEVSAQSTDGQQIVEVGWTVDRGVNGDDEPHLFVYHWVDRQKTCYNGCGFERCVQTPETPNCSATVKPGSVLPVGATKRFTIQHYDGGWWIGYGVEWLGHFPDSLWGGRFTRTGVTQWFGEVSASSPAPCTEMGNGKHADDTSAATFTRIGFYGGPAPRIATGATSAHYSVRPLTANSFRFGGPGAC